MALLSLTGIAQAQAPGDIYNYSRSSSFTYRADGLLESETVEPDAPGLCVKTTYQYDSNGNKNNAETANCAGASGRAVFVARAGTSTFAAVAAQQIKVDGALVSVDIPAGLFASSAANALGQSEQRRWDPRFGALLSLTGPNGLTTLVEVDDFGRKTATTGGVHSCGQAEVAAVYLVP